MKVKLKMYKKLSLRLKITIVATMIMIFIATILTAISVYNANSIFPSAMTDIVLSGEIQYSDGQNNMEFDIDTRSRDNIDIKDYKDEEYIMSKAVYNFKYNAIIYMLLIVVIGAVLIYFILGKMLTPVKELSAQMEIINEHHLSKRITEFNNGDELSQLASSFNTMMNRLDKAFEGQKRFSSDAAHELKTPLTVLKANLDVLDMDENPTNEDYIHIAHIFRKQTERMINLVDSLFTLSSQRSYEFNDTVHFDTIFEDIVYDLQSQITDKNLSVYIDKNNISIIGNKTMITHAISNLVQNAVKYNKIEGSIFIYSRCEGNNCIITVKDTGIGILENEVNNIFEAFYRVDKSRSRKTAGAGLGLAITKDIIKHHKGNIRYIPNDNGGSIFEIVLPIVKK